MRALSIAYVILAVAWLGWAKLGAWAAPEDPPAEAAKPNPGAPGEAKGDSGGASTPRDRYAQERGRLKSEIRAAITAVKSRLGAQASSLLDELDTEVTSMIDAVMDQLIERSKAPYERLGVQLLTLEELRRLAADRTRLFVFLTTWCPFSSAFMEVLKEPAVASELKASGVEVIGVVHDEWSYVAKMLSDMAEAKKWSPEAVQERLKTMQENADGLPLFRPYDQAEWPVKCYFATDEVSRLLSSTPEAYCPETGKFCRHVVESLRGNPKFIQAWKRAVARLNEDDDEEKGGEK